jgi:hypothetical protein
MSENYEPALDGDIRKRIGQLLKAQYQACATNELPPQLLALTKKLNKEPSTHQAPMVRDIES